MDLPTKAGDLNETELSDKLSAQIQATLQTENDLAILVKQRDENKQKAEQIQHLKTGNKFAMTETIKKLVEATTRQLDVDIEEVKEQIRISQHADPQQTARDLSSRLDELRTQNLALHLERQAKEAICDYLSGNPPSMPQQQLKLVSAEEIAKEKDLSKILDELNEKKTRGKRWTGVYSVATTITKHPKPH